MDLDQKINSERVRSQSLDQRENSRFKERQRELFPLSTILEFPNAPTADSWGEVIAEDNERYTVKGNKGGPYVRVAEWMSTKIAERVKIQCATPRIIKIDDGELLFGSRHITGKNDDAVTAEILTSISHGIARTPIPGLTSWISSLCALDMFLNNVDRHENNYISIDVHGTRRFFPIDFGRSFVFSGDYQAFPNESTHTVVRGRAIRKRHGFEIGAAIAMSDLISSVSLDFIKETLAEMPSVWMPMREREQFLNWWLSPLFFQKIERLRKGLIDGTLL